MGDERGHEAPALGDRPIAARLSAALVAFTIEADNEVHRGLSERGLPLGPSLVAWLTVLQHVVAGPVAVGDICAATFTEPGQAGAMVGCLERWGWLWVRPSPTGPQRAAGSPGWGAARGITARTSVGTTALGRVLVDLWPSAIDVVEARWAQRHGHALARAVDASARVGKVPGLLMPDGVPSGRFPPGWVKGDWRQLPAGEPVEPSAARIPVLLGRGLLAATATYEARSAVPLALAANTLRVAADGGTALAELASRSGISPESSAVQCKYLGTMGLAEVVAAGPRRKELRLTAAGRAAQTAHRRTSERVDEELEHAVPGAADALGALLETRCDDDLALRAALVPPPGTPRAGVTAPAPGRTKVSSTAAGRTRDLAAQTEAFLADPLRALPHHPVWDGNRGFGP